MKKICFKKNKKKLRTAPLQINISMLLCQTSNDDQTRRNINRVAKGQKYTKSLSLK